MPPSFQEKYPKEMRNLRLNSRRLTTPFDIHETLLQILNFNKSSFNRYKKKSMQRGISLFEDIPINRTCEDAHIEPHWYVLLIILLIFIFLYFIII